MMIEKPLREKDQAYLDWVKTLPSVVSGRPADDPHHLIGHGTGGTGTKVSDYFTFPLTRTEHDELHNHGWREWEERHGSQWGFVAATLLRAIREGILVRNGKRQ